MNIEARGGDGDAVVSVNHRGQSISLSLAEECTACCTRFALEKLINTALREGRQSCGRAVESDAITDAAAAASMAALRPLGHRKG